MNRKAFISYRIEVSHEDDEAQYGGVVWFGLVPGHSDGRLSDGERFAR